MIFKKGELFSGPGGMSKGAKNATITHPKTGEIYKIEHAWANDIDLDSCKTYGENICNNQDDSYVRWEPVEQLRIGDQSILSDIDCLDFGCPCNDYSQVGEKHGLEGKYGPLFSYGVKAIKEYQPKF